MTGQSIVLKRCVLVLSIISAVGASIWIALQGRSGSERASTVVIPVNEPPATDAIQSVISGKNHQPNVTPEPRQQPTPSQALASGVAESFQLQIEKDGYEPELLHRFVKYAQDAIVAFEGANGERGIAEAKALATRLKELSIISTEPLPRVSANVRVPPGPGPSWSGMSPNDIKDPERRKAYEAARQQNAVDNIKRSWLIQAHATHSQLVIHLDSALTRMKQAGIITREEADEVLLLSRGKQL